MYAILRKQPFDAAKLGEAGEALAEFETAHADQPGYAGFLAVDIGEGRQVTVTLWETQQNAAAGRAELGPRVQRLLEPLLTGPSELLGVGEVVAGDLTQRTGDTRRSREGRSVEGSRTAP